MWTEFIFAFGGFLVGMLVAHLLYAKDYMKGSYDAREIVEAPECFCENGCKYYDEAYTNHEDPDDAWKWLDDNHCSRHCPVVEAQIILFDQEMEERKNGNKDS